MWKDINKQTGSIAINNSYEGERIEEKVERFMNGGEAISDTAEMIYTERKDGVLAEYNIRTDRFDVAIEAMDYVTKSERAKVIDMYPKKEKDDASSESIQGTNDNN